MGSVSAADPAVAEGKGVKRDVAAPEEDGCEGDGGSDYQDGGQQAPEDLENFSDDREEDDDQDMEWTENTINNTPHSVSNTTLRTSLLSKPHAFPLDPPGEIPFSIPVLESEQAASLDPGLHDSTSLRTDSDKTDTVPRVVDLTQLVDGTAPALPRSPESSMTAEQRIKQLEEKVARLTASRLVDADSISRPFHIPLKKSLIYMLNIYLSNRVSEESRHRIR